MAEWKTYLVESDVAFEEDAVTLGLPSPVAIAITSLSGFDCLREPAGSPRTQQPALGETLDLQCLKAPLLSLRIRPLLSPSRIEASEAVASTQAMLMREWGSSGANANAFS